MEKIGLTVSVVGDDEQGEPHLASTAPLPNSISQDEFARYFVKNSTKLLKASGLGAASPKLNC